MKSDVKGNKKTPSKKKQRVIKINYTIEERMLKCGHASFITVVYEIYLVVGGA